MTSGVVRRPLKVAKSVLASIGSFIDQVFKPGPVKVRGSWKSARRIREMSHTRGGLGGISMDSGRGHGSKLMGDILQEGHQEDRRVNKAPRQKE